MIQLEARLPGQADLQYQILPDRYNISNADIALIQVRRHQILPEPAGD
jgi:hypothetical protein